MRVICTAGHVDHGKSTLVEALSGIHPDRLQEEIAREMTIDLGFAWLMLPDGERVGIVDVPGHEDFIENMLAGVGGLDAFLLVIAADEGIMPQTREHLAILQLMGMEQGVVALSKTDAAESQDWLELVELDTAEFLAAGGFADVPIVRVSAHTGAGLAALLETLAAVLAQQPPRTDQGKPLLPIDRVFTLSGFGTVVTGTLSDGVLSVGQMVELQPSGITARIRGLQAHDESVESAQPGSRTAVNLSGVDKSQVRRGDVLSLPGFIRPTLLFDALLHLLPSAQRPLRHNTTVKVFAGPSEALASLRLLDAEALGAGESGYVQLQLEAYLPIRNGQHFILRVPSPAETIGGGVVLESAPGRKWKRGRPEVIERLTVLAHGDPALRLAHELKHKRVPQPLSSFADAALLNRAAQEFGLYELGAYVAHPEAVAALAVQAKRILEAFHAENPLAVGIDPAELLRQLHLDETDTIALTALAGVGAVVYGRLVSLPGWGTQFTKAQQRAVAALLAQCDAAPYATPSYKDALQVVEEGVLKALLAQGELVFIRPDVLLRPAAYGAMLVYARAQLEAGEALTVAALRDHFQTSRRLALPFLDFLESKGITKRGDVGHILRDSANWDAL